MCGPRGARLVAAAAAAAARRGMATEAGAPSALGIARPIAVRTAAGGAAVARVDRHAVHASADARRTRRFWTLGVSVVVAGAGVFGLLNAMGDTMMFYLTPTQLLEKDPPMPSSKRFRLGGMVVPGSLRALVGAPGVLFTVTDYSHDVDVVFSGALPQLFKEGTSAVCEGRMRPNGVFEATEVLAKHDENYMPSDIAEQVAKNRAPTSAAAAPAARAG